jgi:transcriptional regulator with XRE-family HTH domain
VSAQAATTPAPPVEAAEALDDQERARLTAFAAGTTAASTATNRKLPFSFACSVALSGLLATTGTVIVMRPDTAEEVRWAGDSTTAEPVTGPGGTRLVPTPVSGTRPATVAAAEAMAAAATSKPAATRGLAGADAVTRLYELSGLTYKHISKIFGVSERTIHLWAAGQTKPSARHADRLNNVLTTVEGLAASDASTRRALLLSGRSSRRGRAAPVGGLRCRPSPARARFSSVHNGVARAHTSGMVAARAQSSERPRRFGPCWSYR